MIVHTSYAVSLLVAKAKKPHSIGEMLIKQCLVSCAGVLLGESVVSKMKQVSLSNNTVKSLIFNMPCNIKSQLLGMVKASPAFAIQLDEFVDVANLSQPIVFVQYAHDQSIKEDLLFCCPLETTTQAADIMQLVDAFFKEKELGWKKLVHACTDGAPVGCEIWIRETTEAEESQGGDHALHHILRSACIKDDDTIAQRSA